MIHLLRNRESLHLQVFDREDDIAKEVDSNLVMRFPDSEPKRKAIGDSKTVVVLSLGTRRTSI